MATIVGTIEDAGRKLLLTPVQFTTLSAPVLDGGAIVSKSVKKATTDSNGYFSIVLTAGDYQVSWYNGDLLTLLQIQVPSGSASYDISTLVTTSLTYPYTVPPIYMLSAPPNANFRFKGQNTLQLYNTDTGLWHTLYMQGAAGLEQITWAAGEA